MKTRGFRGVVADGTCINRLYDRSDQLLGETELWPAQHIGILADDLVIDQWHYRSPEKSLKHLDCGRLRISRKQSRYDDIVLHCAIIMT